MPDLQHSPEYRTVAAFGNVAEAEIARGVLESDGIPAALQDELDAALLPGAGRSVRVLVPEDDLERARTLLGPAELDADPREDLRTPPLQRPEGHWTLGWMIAVAMALAAALGLAVSTAP